MGTQLGGCSPTAFVLTDDIVTPQTVVSVAGGLATLNLFHNMGTFEIQLDAIGGGAGFTGPQQIVLTGFEDPLAPGADLLFSGDAVFNASGFDLSNLSLVNTTLTIELDGVTFIGDGAAVSFDVQTLTPGIPLPATGLMFLGALGGLACSRGERDAPPCIDPPNAA